MSVISARTGEGLEELLAEIAARLPEGPMLYPEEEVTDFSEREIVADLIREAALRNLWAEVPHGVAVRVDQYKERGLEGAYIEATIFVEKESHKAIVIGKGGAMLKTIGTEARKQAESMSGRKLFLAVAGQGAAGLAQSGRCPPPTGLFAEGIIRLPASGSFKNSSMSLTLHRKDFPPPSRRTRSPEFRLSQSQK